MAETEDHPPEDRGLQEKVLDVLVYVPTGLALSVVDQLPRLAARGRERFGVRVSSARAVGQYAVRAGHHQFLRRSDGWFRRSDRGGGSGGEASQAASTGERLPPFRAHAGFGRSEAGPRMPSPRPGAGRVRTRSTGTSPR